MRISTDQLAQQLSRELKPLYTVFGDEPLLALEASDRIRAQARAKGYIEREVLTVESGFKWSQLAMAANSQSLFASQKLLEIRIPNGKPGVEGGAALQALCANLPAETITLICLPEIDWRSQKAGWFEMLDRSGVTVESKAVTRKALPQWLASRLKGQGQEADTDALAFLAERVEGNLMAAFQEVQKLALLFPHGRIAFEQVRDAVLDVARYEVFNLGEVMLEGDPVRISRTLDGLKGEGAAPPMALWAVAEEIRAIGRVLNGAASGRPLGQLWREARVWGATHQSLMQQNLSRFSTQQVTQGLRHAASIDRMIKGLAKGDVWDELQQLSMRFARQRASASQSRSPRS
mgnify:CR=1 FL=1